MTHHPTLPQRVLAVVAFGCAVAGAILFAAAVLIGAGRRP